MIVSFEQRQQSKTTACVCFEEVTKLKKALLTVSVMSIIIKQNKNKVEVRNKKKKKFSKGAFPAFYYYGQRNFILSLFIPPLPVFAVLTTNC